MKDISDIHAAGGAAAIHRILAAAREIPLDPAYDPAPPVVREPRIRFYDPEQLAEQEIPNDAMLVGDSHVMRGEVFVIGGEPGVGKSRAATALAVSGATGADWLGQRVHRPFRTMIIQNENGRYRLKQEFSGRDYKALKEWIRVSEPPPFGITLSNVEFQHDISLAIAEFRPDCVILDPWNAAAKDDKQRDYAETFTALQNLLPTGAAKPALGIVAHTRKPQAGAPAIGGTNLMHQLAGSHMLASVPRSVFLMSRASEDETDDRVVWFNPKNNNGNLAPRTAWRRGVCSFEAVGDFDWEEFEKPSGEKRSVTLADLREVFEDGEKSLGLKEAVKRLAEVSNITEGAAYNALGEKGRFAQHLRKEGRTISFSP